MSDNWRWFVVTFSVVFTAIMTFFNWARLVRVERILKADKDQPQ